MEAARIEALPGVLALAMTAVHDLVALEAGETAAARLAMACDRMQGVLRTPLGDGRAWQAHGVTRADTLPRMEPAMAVDPALAALIGARHDRARKGGMLPA